MSSFSVKAHRIIRHEMKSHRAKMCLWTPNLFNRELLEQYLSWEPEVHLLLVAEKARFNQAILGNESSPEPTLPHPITRQMAPSYLPVLSRWSSANSPPFCLLSFLSGFRTHFQTQLLDRSMHATAWFVHSQVPGTFTPEPKWVNQHQESHEPPPTQRYPLSAWTYCQTDTGQTPCSVC